MICVRAVVKLPMPTTKGISCPEGSIWLTSLTPFNQMESATVAMIRARVRDMR